jgi:hypothetical protein
VVVVAILLMRCLVWRPVVFDVQLAKRKITYVAFRGTSYSQRKTLMAGCCGGLDNGQTCAAHTHAASRTNTLPCTSQVALSFSDFDDLTIKLALSDPTQFLVTRNLNPQSKPTWVRGFFACQSAALCREARRLEQVVRAWRAARQKVAVAAVEREVALLGGADADNAAAAVARRRGGGGLVSAWMGLEAGVVSVFPWLRVRAASIARARRASRGERCEASVAG